MKLTLHLDYTTEDLTPKGFSNLVNMIQTKHCLLVINPMRMIKHKDIITFKQWLISPIV